MGGRYSLPTDNMALCSSISSIWMKISSSQPESCSQAVRDESAWLEAGGLPRWKPILIAFALIALSLSSMLYQTVPVEGFRRSSQHKSDGFSTWPKTPR